MPDNMTLEELFQKYWKESFPMAPANKQAAASHVAFAQYALTQRFIERERAKDEG
jgi:hypothetical protein